MTRWLSRPELYGGVGLLYATISVFFAKDGEGMDLVFLLTFAVAWAVGRTSDIKVIWKGYLLFMLFPIAVLFFDLDANGLFGNPNVLACAIAMGIAGAFAFDLLWFIPVGVVGLVATHSRGPILAVGVVALAWLWNWSRVIAICLFLISAVIAWSLSGGRDASLWARLGIWQDTINHLTLFGTGYGSFYDEYFTFSVRTNSYDFARASHAYNDALELVFELGLGAIPIWIMIALCLEGPGSKFVPLCFAILSLTYFPLSVFPVGQLFFMSLGRLARERQSNGSLEAYQPPLSKRPRNGMGIQRNRTGLRSAGAEDFPGPALP